MSIFACRFNRFGKSNGKLPNQAWQAAYKKALRHRIESVFAQPPGGQITMRFPRKIHAVTEADFLVKIVLFLLAYTFETIL